MPTEVRITPRADQQFEALDRRQTIQFNTFADDLAARGCAALAYRLSGPTPIDHTCVKHLRDDLRVMVVFESAEIAWIFLVGPHNDQDPAIDVYAEFYRIVGQEPDADSGRAKPACCDEEDQLPPILGELVDDILASASRLRRTRRQRVDRGNRDQDAPGDDAVTRRRRRRP